MSSNGWMITTTVLTNRERGRVKREGEGREGGKEGGRERRVGVCDCVSLFLTV